MGFLLGWRLRRSLAGFRAVGHPISERPGIAAVRDIGGVIGTTVSAGFLLVIAVANIVTLLSIYRLYRGRGRAGDEADFDIPVCQPGIIGRILRPLMAFMLTATGALKVTKTPVP